MIKVPSFKTKNFMDWVNKRSGWFSGEISFNEILSYHEELLISKTISSERCLMTLLSIAQLFEDSIIMKEIHWSERNTFFEMRVSPYQRSLYLDRVYYQFFKHVKERTDLLYQFDKFIKWQDSPGNLVFGLLVKFGPALHQESQKYLHTQEPIERSVFRYDLSRVWDQINRKARDIATAKSSISETSIGLMVNSNFGNSSLLSQDAVTIFKCFSWLKHQEELLKEEGNSVDLIQIFYKYIANNPLEASTIDSLKNLLSSNIDSFQEHSFSYQRYRQALYHGLFLLNGDGIFSELMNETGSRKGIWTTMNEMTDDIIDIYYSDDYLNGKISGAGVIRRELKDLGIKNSDLPVLLIWHDTLENHKQISLLGLELENYPQVIGEFVDSVEKNMSEADLTVRLYNAVKDTTKFSNVLRNAGSNGEISMKERVMKMSDKITVLFLASNPSDQGSLRLDEEARAIEGMIRKSDHRESIQFVTRWAVRASDILQAINEAKPSIIHFSGHGSDQDELILQDDFGETKTVAKEAIVQVMKSASEDIRVVFFNTCFSQGQAQAVVQFIDAAIGMSDSIGDDAARIFAAQFYSAIGFGKPVKVAFEQAKAKLMLEGIKEEHIPELCVKTGVKPEEIVIITP